MYLKDNVLNNEKESTSWNKHESCSYWMEQYHFQPSFSTFTQSFPFVQRFLWFHRIRSECLTAYLCTKKTSSNSWLSSNTEWELPVVSSANFPEAFRTPDTAALLRTSDAQWTKRASPSPWLLLRWLCKLSTSSIMSAKDCNGSLQ